VGLVADAFDAAVDAGTVGGIQDQLLGIHVREVDRSGADLCSQRETVGLLGRR
jgi:hypothetical protein